MEDEEPARRLEGPAPAVDAAPETAPARSWILPWGMSYNSTALCLYRSSKNNVHKPSANFWINLFQRKYVFVYNFYF